MRRGTSSLILGLSLLVASVAWSGFVLLHTVLDPGRSERLADQMLDNAVLRSLVVDAVADSLQGAVPAGVEVSREQFEAAATAALDDPRAEALVRDGIVRIHRNALEGVEEPITLDPTAFGAAARDALVAGRPELAPVLPAAPAVPVTLPDAGLGFLGELRDLLDRAVDTLALVAGAGIVLALVVSPHRPAILRRVAFWAFAASAFWLLLGVGVPWLAERTAPTSAAVFTAAVEVFLGAMIAPAIGLAAAGGGLLVVSLVWDGLRRGPRWSGHRTEPSGRGPDRAYGSAAPGRSIPRRSGPIAQPPAPRPVMPVMPVAVDRTTSVAVDRTETGDPWELTRPSPAPSVPWLPDEDPWSVTHPEPGEEQPPRRRSPRWVEGVGYVEE